MKIGILAVQGAFLEHETALSQLQVPWKEIRCERDLQEHFDGLILPGGESTVQGTLLKELNLFRPLLKLIQNDTPVLATCAGMILLAEQIHGQSSSYFATIPMEVQRNAYGRQLGSFHAIGEYKDLGPVPMTFIRAPYVRKVQKPAAVLSRVNGHIVGVQFRNQIALAFHPELEEDRRIHQAFLNLCR